MVNGCTIDEALDFVSTFVESIGLTQDTIRNYKIHGFDFFRNAFHDNGRSCYDISFAEKVISDLRRKVSDGKVSFHSFQYTRKVHEMLKEYSKTGSLAYHTIEHNVDQPSEHYQILLNDFLSWRSSNGITELTIRGEKSTIRKFLLYLESEDCSTTSAIDRDVVEQYIYVLSKEWPSGIASPVGVVKTFLAFLYVQGLTCEDLSSVMNVIPIRRVKIKPAFETDEVNSILVNIDRETSLGKRDYAMIILAVHTGLRQIDVLNLKLSDIKWKDSEIDIIQHKTTRQLVIPFDQTAGDALSDYILNGRPQSESTYVFLRDRVPFTNLKIGSAMGRALIRKYSKKAGVTWKPEDRKGFHTLRRFLGRSMLENNVPLTTISEVLGHKDKNSTKRYLAITQKHLKNCALSLDGIQCQKEVYQQ